VIKKITLDKEKFLSKFLLPISKLTDNVSILPADNILTAICNSQDSSVVLYVTYKTTENFSGIVRVNLPEIKKFVRLLECINTNTIEFELKGNCLSYQTPEFKFNYFLLDDSYIQKCPINPEKIKQLTFDTEFTLTNSNLNDLLKASSITTDSNKVYLFTRDEKVYAELNDLERQNINNVTCIFSSNYTGKNISGNIPLNIENLRLLAGLKTEIINVSINNELKIVLFEIKDNNTNIKFIISALVK
jgi:hypothetical protein